MEMALLITNLIVILLLVVDIIGYIRAKLAMRRASGFFDQFFNGPKEDEK